VASGGPLGVSGGEGGQGGFPLVARTTRGEPHGGRRGKGGGGGGASGPGPPSGTVGRFSFGLFSSFWGGPTKSGPGPKRGGGVGGGGGGQGGGGGGAGANPPGDISGFSAKGKKKNRARYPAPGRRLVGPRGGVFCVSPAPPGGVRKRFVFWPVFLEFRPGARGGRGFSHGERGRWPRLFYPRLARIGWRARGGGGGTRGTPQQDPRVSPHTLFPQPGPEGGVTGGGAAPGPVGASEPAAGGPPTVNGENPWFEPPTHRAPPAYNPGGQDYGPTRTRGGTRARGETVPRGRGLDFGPPKGGGGPPPLTVFPGTGPPTPGPQSPPAPRGGNGAGEGPLYSSPARHTGPGLVGGGPRPGCSGQARKTFRFPAGAIS